MKNAADESQQKISSLIASYVVIVYQFYFIPHEDTFQNKIHEKVKNSFNTSHTIHPLFFSLGVILNKMAPHFSKA
jgi:hypothetical protein